MAKMIEMTCICGCDETFMARALDVNRGGGKYKNQTHANSHIKRKGEKHKHKAKPKSNKALFNNAMKLFNQPAGEYHE
jgi:hypothetical protein